MGFYANSCWLSYLLGPVNDRGIPLIPVLNSFFEMTTTDTPQIIVAGYTADFGTECRGSIPGHPSVGPLGKALNANVIFGLSSCSQFHICEGEGQVGRYFLPQHLHVAPPSIRSHLPLSKEHTCSTHWHVFKPQYNHINAHTMTHTSFTPWESSVILRCRAALAPVP